MPTATPGGESVAYQMNVAHDGAASGEGLTPPLVEKWRLNLSGAISYPLIAQGKVFVTVANTSGYGTKLYALNVTNGQSVWGPVDIPGTYYWSNAAYDNGAVFVINTNGVLRSFDAETGAPRWAVQMPDQSSFSSPPTAADGVVYVGGGGSGGTLYAVDEATGTVLWTASVVNGDKSSPALSSDGVFVSYTCPNVYKFDRASGALLWEYPKAGCSGGGGKTPVYYQGSLYVRDTSLQTPDMVLDASDGSVVRGFSSNVAPAFSNGRMYLRSSDSTLSAVDPVTGAPFWTFTVNDVLTSAPIVVGGTVYVGSASGYLYAVDATSGQQVWSVDVGPGIPAPDEQNVSQPMTGLGAGNGLLVVPAGSTLVAYSGG